MSDTSKITRNEQMFRFWMFGFAQSPNVYYAEAWRETCYKLPEIQETREDI